MPSLSKLKEFQQEFEVVNVEPELIKLGRNAFQISISLLSFCSSRTWIQVRSCIQLQLGLQTLSIFISSSSSACFASSGLIFSFLRVRVLRKFDQLLSSSENKVINLITNTVLLRVQAYAQTFIFLLYKHYQCFCKAMFA